MFQGVRSLHDTQTLAQPVGFGINSPRALEQFAKVQMLDVVFPTTDRRKLVMGRYTQPDDGLKLLMARM